MPSQADAERLRRAQEGVRVLLVRDLDQFWASLNLSNPERARDALLRYVPILVQQYGESAAALTADWYDEVRAAEAIPGRFRAVMADSPYQDATEPLVRRAAGALFTEAPSGALVTLAASAPKYALAAARSTIQASVARDPRASGWQRVVRPSGCGFCRMLAGRGAVYREATVHFASHGHCNCAAVPSWDQDAPEVDVTIYRASERTTALRKQAATGNPSAIRALEQHNALIRRAIEEYA